MPIYGVGGTAQDSTDPTWHANNAHKTLVQDYGLTPEQADQLVPTPAQHYTERQAEPRPPTANPVQLPRVADTQWYSERVNEEQEKSTALWGATHAEATRSPFMRMYHTLTANQSAKVVTEAQAAAQYDQKKLADYEAKRLDHDYQVGGPRVGEPYHTYNAQPRTPQQLRGKTQAQATQEFYSQQQSILHNAQTEPDIQQAAQRFYLEDERTPQVAKGPDDSAQRQEEVDKLTRDADSVRAQGELDLLNRYGDKFYRGMASGESVPSYANTLAKFLDDQRKYTLGDYDPSLGGGKI